MGLPDVSINRQNGQLGRVKPTIDNVFAFLLSGTAVSGKIGLNDPRLVNGIASLKALGIDGVDVGTERAEATATITNKGTDGNEFAVVIDSLEVAIYTKAVGQTTEAAVATAVAAAIAAATDYDATATGAVITVVAPAGTGAEINGITLAILTTGTATATGGTFAGGESAIPNEYAWKTINKFYAQVAEGTECYIALYANTTMLEDACDKATGAVKTVLDFADGRVRGLFVGKKFPNDYDADIVDGIDADVTAAIGKLQALCEERGAANEPLFAVIPGYGFDIDTVGDMPDLNEGTDNQVAVLIGADDSTGNAAIGTLAGWLAVHEVHQNAARVAHGSVLDEAWLLDGTTAKAARDEWGALHDKRYIFFRKIFQKSGFFFNDDPTATAIDDDFSSISWNRVINKAHVLAYGVLVDRLNDDVQVEPSTGLIAPSLIANWESDVENEIGRLMVNTRQISGVKCTIDPESDIVNDNITADLQIVRNGQAKNITVNIGFVESV